MRTVRTAPVIGLIAEVGLLAVLGVTVGLGLLGWITGLVVVAGAGTALARALGRSGAVSFGAANWITLGRGLLVAGVAALVADSLTRPDATGVLVALASLALALDAVDGRVARRTGTVTAVGARFDMEVDAFLILVLSAYVAGSLGPWVLAIGLARYAFGLARYLFPRLRGSVPPSIWFKAIAAVQGVALVVVATGGLPRVAAVMLLGAALALLAGSFAYEGWWLWRHPTPSTAASAQVAGPDEHAATPAPPLRRRVVAGAVTGLAVLVVWAALVAPNHPDQLTPVAFVRIPIEALAVVAIVLILPGRFRRELGLLVGFLVALIGVVKILDVGFYAALDRPFDPVTDWTYFGPAVGVLRDSVGQVWATVAVVAATMLVLAVLALVTLAMVRLTGVAARHRTASIRAVAGVGTVWGICALAGAQLVAGAPVASTSAAGLAYDQVRDVRTAIRDQHSFAAALKSDDPVSHPAGSDLLTGLRGKDVIIAFVESYGRVAVQDTSFSAGVDAVLTAGTQSLAAAGYSSRSAFLTSPTFGGISWLAHSTLQSGLWIDNQLRYNQLIASRRFTLSEAFHRAGWRTVADVPSNTKDWPEGKQFYKYDQIYDQRNVGYAGPSFSYASMPDQYVLSAFQRRELAKPGHQPVMAEIDLVSSHTPWAPLPTMVDWNAVGDGSIFNGMPARGQSPGEVWRDSSQIKAAYGQSVQYTMSALVSFVQQVHDDNLVLVVLGDHQPATVVSGSGAGHDVPISIIAHDPKVLDRISGWGWDDGLLPGPHAPVATMDTFRNRFLAAYGPHPPTGPPPAARAPR